MSVPISVDRSMTTIYEDNLKKFSIPSLDKQIEEMYQFQHVLLGGLKLN